MRLALLLLIAPALAAAAPTVAELGLPMEAVPGDLASSTVDRLGVMGRLPGGAVGTGDVRMALIGLQQDHLLAPTGWLDADTAGVLGVKLGNLAAQEATAEVLPAEAHQQEALRLWEAATRLQRLALTAGTPAARTRLLAQAEKARTVAQLHAAAGGGSPVAGEAPPVVPEEELTRDQVMAVQAALGVPATGVMDDATRTALSAYQARRGRAATGALDAESLGELISGGAR